MAAVQPHERGRRSGEVERDVEDAEQRRQVANGLCAVLDRLLHEDVEVPLEGDDAVRVLQSGPKRSPPAPRTTS